MTKELQGQNTCPLQVTYSGIICINVLEFVIFVSAMWKRIHVQQVFLGICRVPQTLDKAWVSRSEPWVEFGSYSLTQGDIHVETIFL